MKGFKIDLNRFSEDKVQLSGIKLSLVFTTVLWVLLMILFAIDPFKSKKNQFKTIKITLEKPFEKPVEKTIEKQEIKKAQTVSEKPVSSPAAPAKSSPAPSKNVQKSNTSSPSSASKKTSDGTKASASVKAAPKKENITYKKSLEELMEEQQNGTTPKKAVWDDSIFGDENTNEVAQIDESKLNYNKIDGKAAFSGTAASSSTDKNQKTVAENQNKVQSTSVSSSTQKSLSKIASAKYTQTVSSDTTATSSINAENSTDGKVLVGMTDGSMRILVEPKKPVIYISPENASLIDSSRTVVISFKVLAKGNVPFSEIIITPSSLLPLSIQSEIKEQIQTWRFLPASTDGQARFEYSIIKR